MKDSLTTSDKLMIKRALSYYTQIYFDKGVFINEEGKADVKEECYKIVSRCDEIINKLNS